MSVDHWRTDKPSKQGLLSPPLSQVDLNDVFMNPFISPPPEEALRQGRTISYFYRKHQDSPSPATPNSKPRKQRKRENRKSTSIQASSHKPQTTSRRSSVTPFSTYEYPSDRFTPPREVYVSPLISRPRNSTNKSRRKSVVKELKLVVKTEPPVLDLSLPPPPPSPTDDPLLLTGPPPCSITTTGGKPRGKSPSPVKMDIDFEHQFAQHQPDDGLSEDSAFAAGLIQVSSDSPRAAARAAAILKQHDYDCFTDISSRNASPSNPRFTSVSRDGKLDGLTKPGTPAVDGRRQWTKEDWKMLEACLTQECLEARRRSSPDEGSFVDMTDVRVENVVARFQRLTGGIQAGAVVRSSWSTEELLARAQALQRKGHRGRDGLSMQISRCSSMSLARVGGTPDFDLTLSYVDQRPRLPLPPKELLEKPRGPIETPARPPIVKPIPPKELVELQPVPRRKPSAIPRLAQPRRLVQLRPVVQQAKSRPMPIPRPRRSSGESVKDLIRSFEEEQMLGMPRFGHSRPVVGGPEDKDRRNNRPAWKF